MYLIVGCGELGRAVATELLAGGSEVVGLEADPADAKLVAPKIDVVEHDSIELLADERLAGPPESVLALNQDAERNIAAVRAARERWPSVLIVARRGAGGSVEDLVRAGADAVVDEVARSSQQLVAEVLSLRAGRGLSGLIKILEGRRGGTIAIFLQENPDPDAIGAAMGLARIAENYEISARLIYSGRIGHQQNRAMANLLQVQMEKLASTGEARQATDEADLTALVDAPGPGQYNLLPRDTRLDILLDHHETAHEGDVVFDCVRPDVGATCTIVGGFLIAMGVEITPALASAILLGIRSDTGQFVRKVSADDFRVASALMPIADVALLLKLESPPVDKEALDVLASAIAGREIRGPYLLACGGHISDRDTLPQAADVLMRLEGIETVVVFGVTSKELAISARTSDSRVNIAEMMQEAFGKENAGGHSTMAGAAIDLGIFGETDETGDLLELVTQAVRRRFFKAAGTGDAPESPADPPRPTPAS